MTPYEAVRAQFEFPFELRPYQIEKVDFHAPLSRSALYWEPGVGKTAGSTHIALFQSLADGIEHWVVIMPPILLHQWAKWLKSIRHKSAGELTVTIYHGPPKKRRALDLDVDFILTSPGILKNDYGLLMQDLARKPYGVIVDEAHSIKNIESATHKCVRDFSDGRPFMPLTGTPISNPEDAYAFIKLIAPGVYRNHRHFMKIHVLETDDYDKVIEWDNLDLLAQNLRINSSRILRREVQAQLPPVIYSPLVYELDREHSRLYRKIAEERLLEFSDGREVDAISSSALRTALQQIVVNWKDFDENPDRRPAVMDLIEQTFDEIGDEAKLVVVAYYIRSNQYLLQELQKYGAVAIYGEVSPAKRVEAIKRFTEDPTCRCMVMQPEAGGYGVDGLQHACSEMLVVEAPPIPRPFIQAVARLDRDGQTRPVNCRIAIAQGTVQVDEFRRLLANDAQINSVQGGYKDLRDAVFGG